MAKISFYPTDKKAKGETKLFSVINYGLYESENGKKKYLPLKYPTKISIIPELWKVGENRVKESKKWALPDTYDVSQFAVEQSAKERYTAINNAISEMEQKINSTILLLTKNGKLPDRERLKIELDKIYFPEKITDYTDYIDAGGMNFLQFIDHTIKTSTLKLSTIKSYKVVRNNIADYQKKYRHVLTFKTVDIDFYNSFVKYLTGIGLSKNTIGTRIKIIKSMMNLAYDKGVDVCTDFQKKSFKKPTETTESIYLNTDEISRMYNLQTLPQHLERTRDLFVVGCDTGLRFSDLIRVGKDNITTDNTIEMRTQKTNHNVEIPITPRVRLIFEKYDYKLPKQISNQKYNEFLKEVARRADIADSISETHTKGGMLVTQTVKKWELVTSHTARRSFATNAYNAGVPTIAIMKITGHKTESAFMKYIKLSQKENAIKLQSHKFFTQMVVAK